MGVIFDTSVLVAVMKDEPEAVDLVRRFEETRAPVMLPAPVAYEMLVGILFNRSRREAARFRAFTRHFMESPLDEPTAHRAAEIQADLMRIGRPMSDMDVLVAATAVMGGHTLVTRDKRFSLIAEAFGLDVHVV